jgi:hypothetical protein
VGVFYPDTDDGSSARQSWGARAPRALAIAPSRSRTFECPFQQLNSPLDESAVADASTNPWHAKASATAARGKPKVEQQGEECGFGQNVRADGTFRKISSRKPKFDDA